VLGDDALDRPRHQIGAAACAGGNDELDRPRRLPLGERWKRCQSAGGAGPCGGNKCRRFCRKHHDCSFSPTDGLFGCLLRFTSLDA
jgi:hypothetical protein